MYEKFAGFSPLKTSNISLSMLHANLDVNFNELISKNCCETSTGQRVDNLYMDVKKLSRSHAPINAGQLICDNKPQYIATLYTSQFS